jgi:hypothetical protein
MKKRPDNHPRRPEERHTKRPVTSNDVKMPKVVTLASSAHERKLDKLLSPKKSYPTANKSHNDSHNRKSNSLYKKSFGDLQMFHQVLKISLN